ncbi:putative G-patch domain protein [Blattamonas nauphoetae]|uniref:G-patch domain protein n=1 Tax=Blattamonas nauphoetae TaxID=2049346 RepID=A0ABQ9Y1V1_9EUKA|nr:putative G-patch domain protein [Blattamonas nauphoetae]
MHSRKRTSTEYYDYEALLEKALEAERKAFGVPEAETRPTGPYRPDYFLGNKLPSFREENEAEQSGRRIQGAPQKYTALHNQAVTDDKGRRRLHGAFTGGFSAGFFNTVGSKEGWTPTDFRTSRQNRNTQTSHRIEDYMDSDDFAEFVSVLSLKVRKLYDLQNPKGTIGYTILRSHSSEKELFESPVNLQFGISISESISSLTHNSPLSLQKPPSRHGIGYSSALPRTQTSNDTCRTSFDEDDDENQFDLMGDKELLMDGDFDISDDDRAFLEKTLSKSREKPILPKKRQGIVSSSIENSLPGFISGDFLESTTLINPPVLPPSFAPKQGPFFDSNQNLAPVGLSSTSAERQTMWQSDGRNMFGQIPTLSSRFVKAVWEDDEIDRTHMPPHNGQDPGTKLQTSESTDSSKNIRISTRTTTEWIPAHTLCKRFNIDDRWNQVGAKANHNEEDRFGFGLLKTTPSHIDSNSADHPQPVDRPLSPSDPEPDTVEPELDLFKAVFDTPAEPLPSAQGHQTEITPHFKSASSLPGPKHVHSHQANIMASPKTAVIDISDSSSDSEVVVVGNPQGNTDIDQNVRAFVQDMFLPLLESTRHSHKAESSKRDRHSSHSHKHRSHRKHRHSSN